MQSHQPHDISPSPQPPAVAAAPLATRPEGGKDLSPSVVRATSRGEESIEGSDDSESEAGSSEERDDSDDDDFSPQSGEDSEEELSTAESAESADESEEDISTFLFDVDLTVQVAGIISLESCSSHCVRGKTQQLSALLCSLSQMTKKEKTTSLYTLLAVLMQVPVDRKRGAGERERFNYYLPFVGLVCRPIFARCYGVVPMTLQRYKTRIRDGNMAVKDHGNKLNKNASQVDLVWLVQWFTKFADEVGEVVPVRVRMQKKIDGTIQKFYSSEKYTLLPAHFTWDAIWDEMHAFVESGLRVREPARSTMRKLLTLHCPTIRIRSPRSNVCDVCAIYHAGMRGGVTTEKTEELGRHTESARQMRREYKKDRAACSSDHAVIVMDYSQNLTIPSVANTPSQWYFCSLLSVSCFGIYYENENAQRNYLYDENTSGKGSDQVISMLAHFVETKLVASGITKLTVHADNCSGQNKNNYVIKYFLALVDMGTFDHVNFKFFVKGHTKNSCDRGFGHIRKNIATAECWTMDHIVEAVNAAASNSETVHVPRVSGFFKSYKPVLTELYKQLHGVQQFQLFSMDSAKPGVVTCKKDPLSTAEDRDLRRKIDGVMTAKEKVMRIMTDHVEGLPPPPINAEKKMQMHRSIRPYVPEAFQDDPLYAKPTELEGAAAKTTKQARAAHRAAMDVAAKTSQDQRGRADELSDTEPSSKKKRGPATKQGTTNAKKRKA